MKDLITDETIKGLAQMAENLLLIHKGPLNIALLSGNTGKPLSVGITISLSPTQDGVDAKTKIRFAGMKIADETSDTLKA